MLYPNINAERSRRKLTIEEFAQALGVTRKTVYNWMVHGNIPQSKLEKWQKCSTVLSTISFSETSKKNKFIQRK